ncbi:MAG: hypothetical protein WCI63_03795 [bacterium]
MAKSQNTRKKSSLVKKRIKDALIILTSLDMPMEGLSNRRIERMAMAFLATTQLGAKTNWSEAKSLDDNVNMKTRDIISFINKEFEENISPGSYDDIRRKDLLLLVLGEVVVRTNENSARNDSTRGYALNPSLKKLVGSFGSENWTINLSESLGLITTAKKKLNSQRSIVKIPVLLSSKDKIDINKVKGKAKLEREIAKYNKFSQGVIGQGLNEVKATKLDLKTYAKYVLTEGNRDEKRELLACLDTTIYINNRKLYTKLEQIESDLSTK